MGVANSIVIASLTARKAGLRFQTKENRQWFIQPG
jgi:hypothetical protein